MLFSFAVMLLCALTLSGIVQKLKLPGLAGMILTGIILGPYALNLIAPNILHISSDLRQAALIVILTRAGLALDLEALKKVGRSAVLMCFVPAAFEIAATTLLAPLFFPVSYMDAAVMGAVLGAVSPAVVVPKMLKLIETGYGTDKNIPQLIMAGASVDDVFVIVMFTSLLRMNEGENFDFAGLLRVPAAIASGLAIGAVLGTALVFIFKKIHIRDTVKVLVLLSAAFLAAALEDALKPYFPVSGLLAVMALGVTILKCYGVLARRLSVKFMKIWVVSEIVLFVLVGASVDISYAGQTGIAAVILLICVLCARVCGVFVCLLQTSLNMKERIFCAVSYLPKATVQAAIGGLPLAAGVACGNTILTAAVLSILMTAPLGALGIDMLYKRMLHLHRD